MAHFDFAIPSKLEDLLTENTDYYFVRNLVVQRSISEKLKEGKQALRQDGPEWILDNFDTYYSVLYQDKSVSLDVVYKSYQDLHAACKDFSKCLGFLLEDKSSINEEVQQKYRNVIKMLIYIYIQTILRIEHANVTSAKNQGLLKGRKNNQLENNPAFNLNKKDILVNLNNIIQNEIAVFWDPPVVEENFINLVGEVCYKFLENPQIKGDKDVKDQTFNLIGTLIKTYNHSTTFSIRTSQMVKDHEHLIQCLSEGTKHLVDMYNCKGLIHAFVCEITEWQTDEQFQDSQGSRFCAQFLTSLAIAMPALMLPELLYLNKYLGHESATLRNAVLNVMTEVMIHVLSNHEISKDENEYREGLLSILMEHTRDNSAHVRARVMQHWSRLQKENAVPQHLVNEVLKNIITYHLHDKAALVRKNSVSCLTTFLTYNTYSAQLSLDVMTKELDASKQLLESLQPQIDRAKTFKEEEMDAEWNKMVPELKKFLLELLQEPDSNEEDLPQADNKETTELIRMYINDGKYKEALQIWKRTSDFDDMQENADMEENMDEFLSHLKKIYHGFEIMRVIRNGVSHGDFIMTEEDFQKFEVLKGKVDYLTDAVTFLTLIDSSIELVKELLETTCIGDMHEAVAFFIAAFKFNIDKAHTGVMAMLKIMQRNEQDRKDVIIDAFKTMYLETSASNIKEHSMTIVNRLICLLKSATVDDIENLELIISEWVHKGILDNNIIDMLWGYFTKKIDVTDEYSHASVELLRMAAISRRTVINRNIKLVTSVAFGDRGRNDLRFLGSACNFLAVAGRDRIDITSANPPFSIGHEDSIFTDLFKILFDKFFIPEKFYYHALSGALEFVYKVCGKPHELCQQFSKDIIDTLTIRISEGAVDEFIYIRLCQLIGLIALKHLDYLDETVYKEFKRRAHHQSSKKTTNQTKKVNTNKTRRSKASNTSVNNSTKSSGVDDSCMEGAQAEDQEAEFILHILEKNTVTGLGLLSQLVHIVVNVCEDMDSYNSSYLHQAAVTALIRCMLVSSEFCRQHIQLLFTIFEKCKSLEIKTSILLQFPDLLTRFPNVIEPWSYQIFYRLKDPAIEIRTTTFYTLSTLILRDMVRAHSHIHLMVNSLIDSDKNLSNMCRTFFSTLSHKENNLYNVLPDIFSHLMESDDITEENAKYIMKFLFELIDKTKHMGNLVDRFCSKFKVTDDIVHQRNIAYCLSLISYNDKALNKLQENFPTYKHLVHDPDIYSYFKIIIQGCNKQQGKADLQLIIAELEKRIASVFDVNSDAQHMPPPTAHKRQRKRARKPKNKKDQEESDDDE